MKESQRKQALKAMRNRNQTEPEELTERRKNETWEMKAKVSVASSKRPVTLATRPIKSSDIR